MEKSLTRPEYRLFLAQLRKTRKEAGVSQAELASRLGRTQSFVSKVERGERRLDVIELNVFCKALGISLVSFTKRFASAVHASKSRKCKE